MRKCSCPCHLQCPEHLWREAGMEAGTEGGTEAGYREGREQGVVGLMPGRTHSYFIIKISLYMY